jgi:hypothetical protein
MSRVETKPELPAHIDLRRFDSPDETRVFEKGKFELVRIGGMLVGRASYDPGWRWSEHVREIAGTESCQVAHVGLVLAGRAMVAMDDGSSVEIAAGNLFWIPPGHDSWVLGDEPYVSLHFFGSDDYARPSELPTPRIDDKSPFKATQKGEPTSSSKP